MSTHVNVFFPDSRRRAVEARAGTRHFTHAQRPPHVATSEQDYDDDEREFLFACDAYIRRTGHKFPAFSELLGVAKSLGYAKPSGQG